VPSTSLTTNAACASEMLEPVAFPLATQLPADAHETEATWVVPLAKSAVAPGTWIALRLTPWRMLR
jgi:hypothetical protein